MCSNKGHYDPQFHYAQQVMNHATAASIKAQQQEDSDYQYGIQNAYADQTQNPYTASQQQDYPMQSQQPPIPNLYTGDIIVRVRTQHTQMTSPKIQSL